MKTKEEAVIDSDNDTLAAILTSAHTDTFRKVSTISLWWEGRSLYCSIKMKRGVNALWIIGAIMGLCAVSTPLYEGPLTVLTHGLDFSFVLSGMTAGASYLVLLILTPTYEKIT